LISKNNNDAAVSSPGIRSSRAAYNLQSHQSSSNASPYMQQWYKHISEAFDKITWQQSK
jgi:hypothetical protein